MLSINNYFYGLCYNEILCVGMLFLCRFSEVLKDIFNKNPIAYVMTWNVTDFNESVAFQVLDKNLFSFGQLVTIHSQGLNI